MTISDHVLIWANLWVCSGFRDIYSAISTIVRRLWAMGDR
jgi:hypothetical protein